VGPRTEEKTKRWTKSKRKGTKEMKEKIEKKKKTHE